MDDKFILMGLNDENSKHVAEVLQNKTCKKILDYLSDIKEASEKDIADGLKMPINTAEYNLKKLIKSGLVIKSKNFFWSVKGKKIPMYKLAKKHIIISPNKNPSLQSIKALLPVIIAAIALLLIGLLSYNLINQDGSGNLGNNNSVNIVDSNLKSFNSLEELEEFVDVGDDYGFFGYYGRELLDGGVMKTMASDSVAESSPGATNSGNGGSSASDYSTTNIQVQGVDEADIVKNDGKYIYMVSGSTVYIVEAYPANDMKILAEIADIDGISEIYLNDDKLVIFGRDNRREFSNVIECFREPCYESKSFSVAYTYDIKDRENPKLENKLEVEGNYVDSRMIGDYVYIISSKYIDTNYPRPPIYYENDVERTTPINEVYYWDYYDSGYQFTSITSLDLDDGEYENKVYLMGTSHTLYVSQDNIYLTQKKNYNYDDYVDEIIIRVYEPTLSSYEAQVQAIKTSNESGSKKLSKLRELVKDKTESLQGDELDSWSQKFYDKMQEFEEYSSKQRDKTVVHKINIHKDEIKYVAEGEVLGSVLNQFSMDEYDGNFRIATTSGDFYSGESMNNLYVLDDNLELIGSVEDLAKGEKIYSVRFMGKRAYMVTFKKVDPLFVIDVANPKAPKVLGYLKITGYSDYLHPYDENHIIGIGKETIAASDDAIDSRNLQFAWYQGLKVSLFDVSDVENPTEVGKIVIGDRGTNSDALYDHKAVLFDLEKGILVLPISLAKMDEDTLRQRYGDEIPAWASGETIWQGAYVLNINPEDGINVKGKITHNEEGLKPEGEYGYQYFPYQNQIKRSLYMDNVLYTLSQAKIKANDLDNLEEVNELALDYVNSYPYEVVY